MINTRRVETADTGGPDHPAGCVPTRLRSALRWRQRRRPDEHAQRPEASESMAAPDCSTDRPVDRPDGERPDATGMSDAGMSTVEYAVGTVVAAAFAAVLYKIVTGDSVVTGLTTLIDSALSSTF